MEQEVVTVIQPQSFSLSSVKSDTTFRESHWAEVTAWVGGGMLKLQASVATETGQ